MKKNIWIKGLEIRKMTNKQIANYEFNARITNPNEPSDHELLMELVKNHNSDHELLKQLSLNQASDHELLKQLVTKVNKIEETLNNVIKLNNLRTK